jgi:DEP domain-containing protein 5
MIIHASGDFSKPIIVGYYLYYIMHQDKQSMNYEPPLGDLEAFENEWLEVEIRDPDAFVAPHDVGVPKFLHDDIILQPMANELYKFVHLEIDVNNKSDRTEWGHARYHCVMKPGHAFELVVQWITASGPIINDLLYNWSRKAQQCGFQLVPIPADPLAEPFVEKSDPLRGPIFIPLHIDALNQHRMAFEEFRKDSWPDRWQLFQEAIVVRFGFMPCDVETKTGSNRLIHDHQYVHCSGNMFILVPSTNHQLRYRQRLASGAKKPVLLNRIANSSSGSNNTSNNSSISSTESHDTAIITRHVTGTKNKDSEWDTRRIGFLWSWNHMIHNKKWKSFVINTPDREPDELFQLRMLKDFKDFCANNEDRLVNFWDECWGIKEEKSIRNSVAS